MFIGTYTKSSVIEKKKTTTTQNALFQFNCLLAVFFVSLGGIIFWGKKKAKSKTLFVAICSVDDQIIVMIVKIFMKQKKIINQHQYNIIGNCSCRTHLWDILLLWSNKKEFTYINYHPQWQRKHNQFYLAYYNSTPIHFLWRLNLNTACRCVVAAAAAAVVGIIIFNLQTSLFCETQIDHRTCSLY
jgi:hypothetical protein